MSSNIRIDVDLAGIKRRLKEQQESSRGAQLQKEADRRFANEARNILEQNKQQRAQQQAAVKDGSIPKAKQKRDELSAFRFPETDKVTIATGWITNGRIYSGDGTASIEIPTLSYPTTPTGLPGQNPGGIPMPEPDESPNECPVVISLGQTCDRTGSYELNPIGTILKSPSPNVTPSPVAFGDGKAVVLPAGKDRLVYASEYAYGWAFNWSLWRGLVNLSKLSEFDPSINYYQYEPYFNQTSAFSDSISYCYLVDKSNVTEINGSQLISVLRQSRQQISTVSRGYAPPLVVKASNDYNNGLVSVPTYYSLTDGNFVTADNPSLTNVLWYGLEGTYLGTLGFGQCTAVGGYTPIIFDTIAADTDAFGYDFGKASNYSLVFGAYPNASKCPFVVEIIDEKTAKIWKQPYSSGNTKVDCSVLRQPLKTIEADCPQIPGSLAAAPDLYRLSAWDWNNPAYCLQRLSSLGITL